MYFLICKCLDLFFQSAYLVLMIRVLLSWIPHDRYHPVINIIYKCSEPLLAPFRNIIPAWRIGLDLTPLISFIALGIAQRFTFEIFNNCF